MNAHLLLRKSHRYLGFFIGIQFLAWTISGLYFSWNNIDDVHGDNMRKNPTFVSAAASFVSPDVALKNLKQASQVDSLYSVNLINVAGKPTYQIVYFSGHSGEGHHLHTYYALADASTGELRGPISREEAALIAKDHLITSATVTGVVKIERTDDHHEYRESPLPAWAVTFENPKCTVYISAERGTFQRIRHDQWRMFDFLWMTHTMGYESRDNFNNWLLQIFSVFGLITVVSGFALFIVSSKTLRNKKSV